MALQFPTNPTNGETYRSGSSATYTFDGSYWNILTTDPTSSVIVPTSSYATLARRDITYVTPYGQSYLFWIADGKLFCTKLGDDDNDGIYLSTLQPSGSSDVQSRGIPNTFEIPFPSETTSTIVSITVYSKNVFVLFSNGNLYGWGNNEMGQLGLGNTTTQYTPRLIETNVESVVSNNCNMNWSPNNRFSVVIKKQDGYFGSGYYGAGSNNTSELAQTASTTLTRFGYVADSGQAFYFAAGVQDGVSIQQNASGQIYGIGRNYRSELGHNSSGNTVTTWTNITNAWTQGTSSLTIHSIYAGFDWTNNTDTFYDGNIIMLMTGSGNTKKLIGCGYNGHGQLGIGNTTNQTTPVTCSLPFNHDIIRKVGRRGGPVGTMYVLTTSGSVYAWGYNGFGQVGDGTTTNVTTPKLIATGIEDMLSENTSYWRYTYASSSPLFKKTDGTYHRVGRTYWAGVGNGIVDADIVYSLSGSRGLLPFPSGTNIKLVGDGSSINEGAVMTYVTTDNRVYVHGYNNYYGIQAENGSATRYPVPVEMTPSAFYL